MTLPITKWWNVHPSYWGSVLLGANFTGTVSSPAKVSIPFDRYLIALHLYRWRLLESETLQQTFNAFCRHLCEKTSNVGIWTYFWEVRDDARPWLMARWKAHGRLSVQLNWTFLTICCALAIMRRNVYSSAVFAGVDRFALKFYLKRSSPSTILGVRKLETWATRRWKPHPSAFPRFETIPECDRRTERQTDGQTDGRTDLP